MLALVLICDVEHQHSPIDDTQPPTGQQQDGFPPSHHNRKVHSTWIAELIAHMPCGTSFANDWWVSASFPPPGMHVRRRSLPASQDVLILRSCCLLSDQQPVGHELYLLCCPPCFPVLYLVCPRLALWAGNSMEGRGLSLPGKLSQPQELDAKH